MKVAIVEPSALIRELMIDICQNTLGFQVELLSPELGGQSAPYLPEAELYLLSLNLAGGTGLYFAKKIQASRLGCRIILTFPWRDSRALVADREIMPHGLVELSQVNSTELTAIISNVAAGRRIRQVSREFEQLNRGRSLSLKMLSPYEQELLVLFAQAMTDEEAARSVGISPATMQSRRRDIMRKLNLRSTPKLMRFALVSGYSHPQEWSALEAVSA
jgi:DNA-binding NarL/FixJ family response regulator